MWKIVLAWLAVPFLLTLGSPGFSAEPEGNPTYYTRVGFSYEEGVHLTTNYLRGTRVPINTRVEVLKRKTGYVRIRIADTGAEIKIENVKEFSGEDINGIFDRMFSRETTDLSGSSPEKVKLIMAGAFEPGMTKEEVIRSIGYPPRHKTPTLEGNSWRYWRDRFDTVLLNFKDGVLDNILD